MVVGLACASGPYRHSAAVAYLCGVKSLTSAAPGLLAASILRNVVSTQPLSRAQPRLTISFGMLFSVQPLLLLSLIAWVGRRASAGRR